MKIPQITASASRVLEAFWLATADDASLDIDQPSYLHLHAERIARSVLAVSHTFEQNGDLMRDPEIVFFRAAPGLFYVLECTQDPAGSYTLCAERDASGTRIAKLSARAMRDVGQLATMWMRNLPVQFPAVKAMLSKAV